MSLFPVILCGGAGTRLWPASHAGRPKQFTAFIGEHSLFQQTVSRMAGLPGAEQILVVAGRAHADMIDAQLKELRVDAVVLLEPEARDSAPAIAAACAWIAARDPEGIAIIVASDHHVPDAEAFRAAALTAARAAKDARIVTMGVKPRAPSTAYGYIAPGDALGEVRAVRSFVEKPDAATAQSYVDAGYLWNSGNFVAQAATLLAELDQYAPAIASAARAAVAQAQPHANASILGEAFRAAPKISIDYAVMEKTARTAVVPVDFAWSDLGAWDAVRDASEKDAAGNASYGEPILINAANTLVRVSGARVAVIGVSNVAVVVEGNQVLVCDLAQSQAVKAAVDRMRASPQQREAPFTTVDAAAHWFDQWLRTSALPLWWTLGADHVRGGYHETLTQAGEPTYVPRRARVQARQAFVYARAGHMGWGGPWRDAAWHGLGYMLDQYRRPDALFRTLVDGAGAPLDDSAKNYDQAFVLLAMAEVQRADTSAQLEPEATALLHALQSRRHTAGGFREDGAHPFQSNAHMHLFEAALGWVEAGGGTHWHALADEIANLALAHFIDTEGGFVREFFDDAWSPAPGADGQRVEPGHQFEWAWLLHRWGAKGNADATKAARRLYAAGLHGVDATRHVAIDALSDDLAPLERSARLWPQTEFLKAALVLGDDAQILTAARAVAAYLDTPIKGLWRDKMTDAGELADEPAPASSFYHVIIAIDELRKRTVA